MKNYTDLSVPHDVKLQIDRLAPAQREFIQGLTAGSVTELLDTIRSALAFVRGGSAVSSASVVAEDEVDFPVPAGSPTPDRSNQELLDLVRRQAQDIQRLTRLAEERELEDQVERLARLPPGFGPDAQFLSRLLAEHIVLEGVLSAKTYELACLRMAYFVAFYQSRDSERAAAASDPSWLQSFRDVMEDTERCDGVLSRLASAVTDILLKCKPAASTKKGEKGWSKTPKNGMQPAKASAPGRGAPVAAAAGPQTPTVKPPAGKQSE